MVFQLASEKFEVRGHSSKAFFLPTCLDLYFLVHRRAHNFQREDRGQLAFQQYQALQKMLLLVLSSPAVFRSMACQVLLKHNVHPKPLRN